MNMRRREFSRSAVWAAASLGMGMPLARAEAPAFKEGKDYLKLRNEVTTDVPAGKVEVLEFFGYWCPHCAHFEPTFEAWVRRAPSYMVVRRVPVAFQPSAEPLQRLYYVLEGMGKLDELHGKVFIAIHNERQHLATMDEIANWVAKQGVDRAKFVEFYNSFSVVGKVKRAKQLLEGYAPDGVPSLGVAGKYYTSGTEAGSMDRVLSVVEHLAEISRKG
jgi:thiol:disulfide interchange protein DsbA